MLGLLAATRFLASPDRHRQHLEASECAAIVALKNIHGAQLQMRASAVIDVDGNGAGECGFLAELAGTAAVRGGKTGGARFAPPSLDQHFGEVRGGRVTTGGYVFQMFLPGKDGSWTAEHDRGGGAGSPVDAARAEVQWICYAWPQQPGWSGRRSFLMTWEGNLVGCDNTLHPGQPEPRGGISGFVRRADGWKLAAGTVDAHGDRWNCIG